MNENQRVYRVPKDRNFTVVKNHFIDDRRLSLKATAILLLALRYPDNWRMSVKGMTRLKSDKESSISSGFKELVAFGYAEYRKTRNTITGKFESGWYFFEESQKPDVQSMPNRSKKEELKQGELFAEEEIKSPVVENPGPDLPLQGNPHLENPVAVNPSPENQTLPNTIYQRLSKQVLSSQILKASREYRPSAQAHREEHNQDQHKQKEKPRFQFPAAWLTNFQDYYLKEHGSAMGQPASELKALNLLFEFSKGEWNVIESKIKILIQLRKQDSKFWYEQSVSPESISKFWSRLFVRNERRAEKSIMRTEKQNLSKFNERKPMPDKPIEIKDLDPYKCFLVWGKTKLLKPQLEYYEQNSDPLKYEGTKKILFEKFVNEIYPGLIQNSEIKKTTIENGKENSQESVA
ncbi:helix-turn-helix domain-containing protein (plasmid) [Leptospira weilii]|uniref:helix-turn-helix domain-containing protein n=1 Tax=Leptospira weilii TaxID=28184 RepID=UPI00201B8008|nr:helix-turn-helix domain-containing protein [Leptospira weilii]UPY81100.1 helix-turn-helix domain-containing protein [Leptospira weilii]UPY81177.1 helix-turn-helix domain-containing protein [Leptospira weilii]